MLALQMPPKVSPTLPRTAQHRPACFALFTPFPPLACSHSEPRSGEESRECWHGRCRQRFLPPCRAQRSTDLHALLTPRHSLRWLAVILSRAAAKNPGNAGTADAAKGFSHHAAHSAAANCILLTSRHSLCWIAVILSRAAAKNPGNAGTADAAEGFSHAAHSSAKARAA